METLTIKASMGNIKITILSQLLTLGISIPLVFVLFNVLGWDTSSIWFGLGISLGGFIYTDTRLYSTSINLYRCKTLDEVIHLFECKDKSFYSLPLSCEDKIFITSSQLNNYIFMKKYIKFDKIFTSVSDDSKDFTIL